MSDIEEITEAGGGAQETQISVSDTANSDDIGGDKSQQSENVTYVSVGVAGNRNPENLENLSLTGPVQAYHTHAASVCPAGLAAHKGHPPPPPQGGILFKTCRHKVLINQDYKLRT